MDYSVYLNLHVTAVIVWVVSMLSISVLLAASAGYDRSGNSAEFSRLRWVNRFVTTPFMLLTWILGITLAVKGGWFGAGWLSVKLAFVLVLSAVHGIQTRSLRRLTTSPQMRIPLLTRLLPVVVIICALVIVALALTKPF